MIFHHSFLHTILYVIPIPLFLIFSWYFITHSFLHTIFYVIRIPLFLIFQWYFITHNSQISIFNSQWCFYRQFSPFFYALCDVLARNDISSRLRLSARNASQSNADIRTTGHLHWGVPSPSAVASYTEGFLHPQQLPAALRGFIILSSCQLHWGAPSYSAVVSCTEWFLDLQQLPAVLRGVIILSSCQLHCSM